jgi:hypothetical protein
VPAPGGHWYEFPNLLRNGVLRRFAGERPQLRHLMLHNIDTVGADLDPALLGLHHMSRRDGADGRGDRPAALRTAAADWRASTGAVRLVEGWRCRARRWSST